jgi:ferredoxin-type protein NapF
MHKPAATPSRRAFLFGAQKPRVHALRPPWSVPESDFANACTGCGDCIAACPESILALDPDQLAYVDFTRGQNACTFCAACAETCQVPAFLGAEERMAVAPWTLRAQVGEACLTHAGVMCQSCKDACGDGAIRFSYGAGRVARPVIDLASCTGCGACQAPCPANAISFAMTEPLDVS